MTWLVRSPFSRAVDRSLTLITVRGRRSGTPYTLPVQYAEADGRIWVMPGHADTKTWWRNLLAESEVELHLRGHEIRATAQAFSGDTSPSVVEEGLTAYFGRFPVMGRRSGAMDKTGVIDQARLAEMAKGTVIVRLLDRGATRRTSPEWALRGLITGLGSLAGPRRPPRPMECRDRSRDI